MNEIHALQKDMINKRVARNRKYSNLNQELKIMEEDRKNKIEHTL